MTVDFPNNPPLNEIFYAPNGLVYKWDGVKWKMAVGAEDNLNYWVRDAIESELQPKSSDDTILFAALGIDRLSDLP